MIEYNPINKSKVIKWLLDNNCPFDFNVEDSYWENNSCVVVLTDKEKED